MSVWYWTVLPLAQYVGMEQINRFAMRHPPSAGAGSLLWSSYLDEGAHEANNLILHCLDVGLHDTQTALLVRMLQEASAVLK